MYSPLSEESIQRLLKKLMDAFPPAVDFSDEMKEHPPRPSSNNFVLYGHSTYRPVSEEDIEFYSLKRYPKWAKQCDEFLRSLHNSLNPQLLSGLLTIDVSNVGYAVAVRSEISFTSKGQVAIAENSWTLDQIRLEAEEMALPNVPTPPKGVWVDKYSRDRAVYGHALSSASNELYANFSPPPLAGSRDKNGFYYLTKDRTQPVKNIVFECEEWRHRHQTEPFTFKVFSL